MVQSEVVIGTRDVCNPESHILHSRDERHYFRECVLFVRHSILGRYGCSTGRDGFLILGLDARLFRQLGEAVDSERLRNVFEWINTLIPVLAVGAMALCFIGAVLMR